MALCVWHKEVDWTEDPPARMGNFKTLRQELQTLSDKSASTAEKGRVGIKIKRAYEFAKLVRVTYLREEPVRLILLDGERVFGELAATSSSKVRARLLDAAPWFVHDCDIEQTGHYKIVRNTPYQSSR